MQRFWNLVRERRVRLVPVQATASEVRCPRSLMCQTGFSDVPTVYVRACVCVNCVCQLCLSYWQVHQLRDVWMQVMEFALATTLAVKSELREGDPTLSDHEEVAGSLEFAVRLFAHRSPHKSAPPSPVAWVTPCSHLSHVDAPTCHTSMLPPLSPTTALNLQVSCYRASARVWRCDAAYLQGHTIYQELRHCGMCCG